MGSAIGSPNEQQDDNGISMAEDEKAEVKEQQTTGGAVIRRGDKTTAVSDGDVKGLAERNAEQRTLLAPCPLRPYHVSITARLVV